MFWMCHILVCDLLSEPLVFSVLLKVRNIVPVEING